MPFSHRHRGRQRKTRRSGAVASWQEHPIVVFDFCDDDGSQLQMKSSKPKATVQDGGKATTVAVSPSGPDMMVGKTEAELAPRAKIVLSATMQLDSRAHTSSTRLKAN